MKQVLSTLMAVVLALTGCAGPGGIRMAGGGSGSSGGGGQAEQLAQTLAQAVYPEFPQRPVAPLEGPIGSWEAYSQAYDKYIEALRAIRGDNSGLTEAEHSALNTFAAKSTALAMAGHEGENAIYSPLSLWSALALLAQCADGNSRQQVLDALGIAGAGRLQEDVSHIWRTLYTDDGLSSLILANSVWLNSNLEGSYVQDTLDTLAQKHFAGVYAVPMGTSGADQAVTQWIKEQTNGLIGGDSPVVQTMPETLALLVSSLYYRAAWLDEFNASQTEKDTFTGANRKESTVDFMHKTQRAGFLRREGYQAASLSTQLGEMVFVLPDEGVTPESLLQNAKFLSGLEFHGNSVTWGEVQWSVPKFDVNSDLNLKETLTAMGITDLLDENRADLSALTSLDAFLSDAKQLARVKVDEEGVEAAAVTIIDMATSGMPEPNPEICVMNLNRPFLFVIRTQGVPLFVGVVNQV